MQSSIYWLHCCGHCCLARQRTVTPERGSGQGEERCGKCTASFSSCQWLALLQDGCVSVSCASWACFPGSRSLSPVFVGPMGPCLLKCCPCPQRSPAWHLEPRRETTVGLNQQSRLAGSSVLTLGLGVPCTNQEGAQVECCFASSWALRLAEAEQDERRRSGSESK